jgi:hypothetical protein
MRQSAYRWDDALLRRQALLGNFWEKKIATAAPGFRILDSRDEVNNKRIATGNPFGKRELHHRIISNRTTA